MPANKRVMAIVAWDVAAMALLVLGLVSNGVLAAVLIAVGFLALIIGSRLFAKHNLSNNH